MYNPKYISYCSQLPPMGPIISKERKAQSMDNACAGSSIIEVKEAAQSMDDACGRRHRSGTVNGNAFKTVGTFLKQVQGQERSEGVPS